MDVPDFQQKDAVCVCLLRRTRLTDAKLNGHHIVVLTTSCSFWSVSGTVSSAQCWPTSQSTEHAELASEEVGRKHFDLLL